ncbi:MAG: type IV secretory system conjugative DNA transfer family protein [Oscillospiraceae bacterium]|nr:type IV secretory system conjugative DNA transfer family protein [Oscillospiraceae bacterium]MDE7094415.1 type IV secretory system conjugative DNA transfer family protein [Oscillospiraceae bacterium]
MKMDRMILGEGAVYSTNCNETGLNNNVIVCASSGGGKTMSIMEPRLLETFHSSLVVTVTKRKLVNKYKTVFSKRGYNVLDLNFVKPIESNIAYDPLEYVSSYSDISFLSESIVKANPRKENSTADPYWDDAAISLLSALIAYVLMTEDKPTFADVLKLNDTLSIKESTGGSITTTLDRKFNMVAQKSPTCFAMTCWNSFKVLPFKTASCVYGALNTTIDTIFSPELRTMITEKNKVNFEELASQKTVLFISTSAVNPALSCFINMFYAQMFKQLFEFAESLSSGTLPIPVSVLCDDFATGSRILNFPEYISIFREKQISVMLLLQSESQLERMYGHEDSVTIINNCDTYVYMGGMDLRTCRNISERLNVPLDEVLYMPLGQEVIFRRGQKPIITQRYNVLTDKTYLEITEQYEKRSRN